MEGISISSLYSYGCPELKQIGAERVVFDFIKNPEKSQLTLIKTILEKLEPFDQKVVKPHWLSTDLLKRMERKPSRKFLKFSGCF